MPASAVLMMQNAGNSASTLTPRRGRSSRCVGALCWRTRACFPYLYRNRAGAGGWHSALRPRDLNDAPNLIAGALVQAYNTCSARRGLMTKSGALTNETQGSLGAVINCLVKRPALSQSAWLGWIGIRRGRATATFISRPWEVVRRLAWGWPWRFRIAKSQCSMAMAP